MRATCGSTAFKSAKDTQNLQFRLAAQSCNQTRLLRSFRCSCPYVPTNCRPNCCLISVQPDCEGIDGDKTQRSPFAITGKGSRSTNEQHHQKYLKSRAHSRKSSHLNYRATSSSWCWYHRISYYRNDVLPQHHRHLRQNVVHSLPPLGLYGNVENRTVYFIFHHFERRRRSHTVTLSCY